MQHSSSASHGASELRDISGKMMSAAAPLLMSVLRAGVSHGYKRSETSPVALPRAVSPPLLHANGNLQEPSAPSQ